MFRKILHANDGSDRAFNALSLALQIARHDQAELHMVLVEERGHMSALAEEATQGVEAPARFDRVLHRARTMADHNQVKLQTHVLAGHPARDVVKLASDLDVDLIVVGSSGHSSLYDRMIGSRAQKILHHAPCPVLVVK